MGFGSIIQFDAINTTRKQHYFGWENWSKGTPNGPYPI
jgi:hypothetical protein